MTRQRASFPAPPGGIAVRTGPVRRTRGRGRSERETVYERQELTDG